MVTEDLKERQMKTKHIKHIATWAVSLLIAFTASAKAWETTVNGRPTSDMDTALGVAVDPATGSIFVQDVGRSPQRHRSSLS
jgi:hypothetical protein